LANANREYLHFNYSALGDDFKEAFITIITKPKYVFDLLYENHTHNPDGDGAKSELHMMILMSGGLFLLYRPQFLIMLIPIYAQKLFNDDFVKWGINYQYSIEFSPILTLAAFTSIIYIKKYTTQLSLIITVLTFATTISSLDHRVSNWYMPELSRFYSTAHYTVDFDRREVVKAIAEIPANASVSATNSLVPHMAFRDYIYQYPDGKNCDYVVLLNVDNVYPLRRGMLYKDIKKLLSSPAYQCLHKTNRLYIFKKLR
ncbi:MAG: DUF2079 domain-containing protein, partial [Bacteroidota bacterium]